jgi:hypothetical protein
MSNVKWGREAGMHVDDEVVVSQSQSQNESVRSLDPHWAHAQVLAPVLLPPRNLSTTASYKSDSGYPYHHVKCPYTQWD